MSHTNSIKDIIEKIRERRVVNVGRALIGTIAIASLLMFVGEMDVKICTPIGVVIFMLINYLLNHFTINKKEMNLVKEQSSFFQTIPPSIKEKLDLKHNYIKVLKIQKDLNYQQGILVIFEECIKFINFGGEEILIIYPKDISKVDYTGFHYSSTADFLLFGAFSLFFYQKGYLLSLEYKNRNKNITFYVGNSLDCDIFNKIKNLLS